MNVNIDSKHNQKFKFSSLPTAPGGEGGITAAVRVSFAHFMEDGFQNKVYKVRIKRT